MLTNILKGPVSAIARAFALLGGVVLVALMLLVVISITGRALIPLGLKPVPGDFELVEMGTAFAIFCFLPWCQLQRGHVSVDILAPMLGRRRDAALSVFHNLAMTVVSAFIAWRLWAGMLDKMQYKETTYILGLPVWWGYALCVPLAAAFVLVSAFTVIRSAEEALMRRAGT